MYTENSTHIKYSICDLLIIWDNVSSWNWVNIQISPSTCLSSILLSAKLQYFSNYAVLLASVILASVTFHLLFTYADQCKNGQI